MPDIGETPGRTTRGPNIAPGKAEFPHRKFLGTDLTSARHNTVRAEKGNTPRWIPGHAPG
jgi:hypothetical protein